MRCLSLQSSVLCRAPVARATAARSPAQAPALGRRAARCVVRAVAEEKDAEKEEEPEFIDLDAEDDGAGLTTEQVMQLTDLVCNETNLAQVGVKYGDFEFSFTRTTTPAAPAAAPVAAAPAAAPAPAPAAPAPATPSDDESDDEDADGWEDEALIVATAPKVGILRRGRYVKGRRVGKGSIAEVGDTVKKGQALAFVEQLGTYVPVEADQAGEIVSFLVDEGEPVEYQQDVIKIAPFFGGHIIGDRKNA